MPQHLVHIGYPKAGSSFLQAWFERHTQLHYAPGALAGFHNVYELARPSDRAYKYYVTSFEGLSTPHKDAGRINLTYGGAETDEANAWKRENQNEVCGLLQSLYPGSRVMIVTRGFKGMITSGYSQYVRMGGRHRLDGMCRELAASLEAKGFDYYDFDYLIGIYAKAFGDKNVLVLPYELLRDNSTRFIQLIEQWLGLEHEEIEVGRVNPSLSAAELYWYPKISNTVAGAASWMGNARFRSIYTWYIGKTMNNKLRLPIRLLHRLSPKKKITGDYFPEEILDYFGGKAKTLQENPLYKDYASEYLFDEKQDAP